MRLDRQPKGMTVPRIPTACDECGEVIKTANEWHERALCNKCFELEYLKHGIPEAKGEK